MRLTILLLNLCFFFSCQQNKDFEDAVNGLYDTAKLVELKDKQVKVLWREDIYDEKLKDTVNSIVLNKDYFKDINEVEKAIIAYIATFIGNECQWDGEPNTLRSNLKCQIISELNLGYQCSDQHKNFILKWFGNDSTISNELKNCPMVPFTASSQTTFDEINIITKGNQIIVELKAGGANMQVGQTWTWSEKRTFEYKNNIVKHIKTEETKPIYESFGNEDESEEQE